MLHHSANHLCFVNNQHLYLNGMLEPWFQSKGLGDADHVLAYFAVSKLGEPPMDGITDANPEGLTAAFGKWASAVTARLQAGGLSCKVLEKEPFQKQMLEKLILISAFMLVGARYPGATVGDVEKDHRFEVLEDVEVEYIPEKAEPDGFLDNEFRKVFEKFTFKETAALEENDQKEEAAANAALNKKASSDSEEEDQDTRVKDKGGISNKKKKLERRMKIAELKQISARPDVVEVWDATSADPKLLVFLKSYHNTVPVPRHWCQKRKFLQGNGCDNLGAWTWEAWY